MQFLVEDSTNANERAILIEGWTKDNPPVPLDIASVTLRVSINGGAAADADGTTTRLDSSHVHRFVFDNDTQFQAFAAGDIGVLIVPDSASGSGRLGMAFPFLVAAGNLGAASLTAEDVAAELVNETTLHGAIATATVTAEIAALDGFTASDTALTIDGVAHTITRNDTDGYVASITAD
jgi:hypothetical protein